MFFLLNPKTRNFYKKHGEVYTLRAKLRKRTGPDCIAASRNPHIPLGKGLCSHEKTWKKLTPALLKPYLKKSGFSKSADWINALLGYTSGKMPSPVYLYRVERLSKPRND